MTSYAADPRRHKTPFYWPRLVGACWLLPHSLTPCYAQWLLSAASHPELASHRHSRHVVACAPHPGYTYPAPHTHQRISSPFFRMMLEVGPPVLARYFRYLTLLSISLRHLS